MIIINQDNDTIVNFSNIEAIEITYPLERDNGKFVLTANSIMDNQYTLAEYEKEERAREVLLMLETILASTGDLEKEYFLMPKE